MEVGTIEAERIATMAYAPEGNDAINLYSVGTASGLTLGQLVLAVSIHRVVMLEQRAVVQMNKLAAGNELMEKLSSWMSQLSDANASVDTPRLTEFLLQDLRLDPGSLPASYEARDARLSLLETLKERMEKEANMSQKDMIEMQSTLNVRDIASTLSANMVRGYGATGNTLAGNLVS